MNPNHVSILRLYTREQGELTEDSTLGAGNANEIVVEWEVGGAANAAFAAAGSLELEVRTFDLNGAGGDGSLQPTIFAAATFVAPQATEGQHRNFQDEHVHLIAAGGGLIAGHMYECIARLSAPHVPPGSATITVSFAKWMFYVY